MIELRGLTKKFGDFTAVDGLSFEIKTGESEKPSPAAVYLRFTPLSLRF